MEKICATKAEIPECQPISFLAEGGLKYPSKELYHLTHEAESIFQSIDITSL